MGLETADFVSELVITNPLPGDDLSGGDDHIRLIKKVETQSFPDVDKAVGTVHMSSAAPANPVNGTVWRDTVNDKHKFWDATLSAWQDWDSFGEALAQEGDLLVYDGQKAARLPKGNENQLLSTPAEGATQLEWKNRLNYKFITQNHPVLPEEQGTVFIASGVPFTATLPSAASGPGLVYYFVHKGDPGTQIYTVEASGGDMIGDTKTSIKLSKYTERVGLVSDGVSNWTLIEDSRFVGFSAYLSVDQGIPVDIEETVLQFDSATDNPQEDYDNTTFRYTPKEPGHYSFRVTMGNFNSISAGKNMVLTIVKNGTTLVEGKFISTGTSKNYIATAEKTVYMNGSTDYVDARAVHDETYIVQAWGRPRTTFFEGHKIR